MDAVQQLEAKASLLDVNQLDTIETRLGTLIYRMDSITQKKAAAQDSEQEQKVCIVLLLELVYCNIIALCNVLVIFFADFRDV